MGCLRWINFRRNRKLPATTIRKYIMKNNGYESGGKEWERKA